MKRQLQQLRRRVVGRTQEAIDHYYLGLDRRMMRHGRNLDLVPYLADRRAGRKSSYGEWCHGAGLFQALIAENVPRPEGNVVLDVGCGTGLLAIAAEPFLAGGGRYIGVDVQRARIDFGRRHYPADRFEFVHSVAGNDFYAPTQAATSALPCGDASVDLVTALSVWTHFNEDDARFYLGEVARVLRPGARAIITFFVLDADFETLEARRGDNPSRFNRVRRHDFSVPCSASGHWRADRATRAVEAAVGVTEIGLAELVAGAGLSLRRLSPCNWKERPGLYSQDVVILEK